jgi:hypothetical protein
LNWLGYQPAPPVTSPSIDERRLAFQALSEGLKTGITGVSIGFVAIGALGLQQRSKAFPRDMMLAAVYALVALVSGLWGLLAIPQSVHTKMVTYDAPIAIFVAPLYIPAWCLLPFGALAPISCA